MSNPSALPKGRYFPTGRYLGVASAQGVEGPGNVNFKNELRVYPSVLKELFENLQAGPDQDEFLKLVSNVEGLEAQEVLDYLQEQELVVGLGGDQGVEVLNDLMLVINLTPLEESGAAEGKSYYATKEATVLELSPFTIASALTNNTEVSLMEAAFSLSVESKIEVTLILACILEDLPVLIASGGGSLEVIR